MSVSHYSEESYKPIGDYWMIGFVVELRYQDESELVLSEANSGSY